MEDRKDSKTYESRLQEINQCKAPQQQVEKALSFMKDALSDPRGARFREFWKMKKNCLEFFKGDIHPAKRSIFWQEYTDLLTQAHGLQRFLDEQIEFQVQQIEKAISALEIEGLSIDKELCEVDVRVLDLLSLQTKAVLLHSLKQRILALRSEIIALEMRISRKNKLLDKLSKLADRIFPKRKDVVTTLSAKCFAEVEGFVKEHFQLSKKEVLTKVPLNKLRKQIKHYQGNLKELFVNNETYTKVRALLSQCWDALKHCEDQQSRLDAETLEQRQKSFETYKNEILELSLDKELFSKVGSILQSAREAKLGREFFQELQKVGSAKRSEWQTQLEREKKFFEEREQERQREHSKNIEDLLGQMRALVGKGSRMKLETLSLQTEEIFEQSNKLQAEGMDGLFITHELHRLKTLLLKKQAKRDDESEQDVLDEGKGLRDTLKQQIRQLRQEIPNSGLDIERVALLENLIKETKNLVFEIEREVVNN